MRGSLKRCSSSLKPKNGLNIHQCYKNQPLFLLPSSSPTPAPAKSSPCGSLVTSQTHSPPSALGLMIFINRETVAVESRILDFLTSSALFPLSSLKRLSLCRNPYVINVINLIGWLLPQAEAAVRGAKAARLPERITPGRRPTSDVADGRRLCRNPPRMAEFGIEFNRKC